MPIKIILTPESETNPEIDQLAQFIDVYTAFESVKDFCLLLKDVAMI